MKSYLKVFNMTIVGLLVSIIFYPFIHELGHIIATILVGGKYISFDILPFPNVLCDVSGLNYQSLAIIGLSGLLLPVIISLTFNFKTFYLWYAVLILKGISLLSMIISFVIALMYSFLKKVEGDDITKVLDYWNDGQLWIMAGTVLISIAILLSIFHDRPVKKVTLKLLTEKQPVFL